MSSLLFQHVREELGLCYSIYSDYELFDDVGSFSISAALDGSRYEQATDTIQQVVSKFVAHGPSYEMLANAKRYAIIQNKLALEDSQSYMQWIGDSVSSHNRVILPAEVEQQLIAVTLDEVMQVASECFDEKHKATAQILPE